METNELKQDVQATLLYEVDNRKISLDELTGMLQDPKIKLVKLTENTYKTLQRLYG
jgi:beta-lactamase class A